MENASLAKLALLDMPLDVATTKLLSDAEIALHAMKKPPADDELAQRVFSDICLRLESLGDRKMAGRQDGVRALLRESFYRENRASSAPQASFQDSLHNTEALLKALELGDSRITRRSFLQIHQQLLAGTTRESFRGRLRSDGAQVGGSRFHELGSHQATTPPELIPVLLDELAEFCNSAALPAVAQAAIAHAQFIAIHPFERANGKTARAMIQLVLKRRGVIDQAIVPLSVALVPSVHDYNRGAMCLIPKPGARGVNAAACVAWLDYFAASCQKATEIALGIEKKATSLREQWIAQTKTRADSAATLIMRALPAMPVFSVASASAYLDRSFTRTTKAVDELVSAGIVEQITEGKRNRVFECPRIIDLYASIPGFQ